MHILLPEALAPLAAAYAAAGGRLYAVGGAVRNALLGLPRADMDITGALPQAAVRALCDGLSIPCAAMSTALGTLQLRLGGEVCEYTPFRSERYAPGGAHRPEEVRFGASMAEDAARRDFTVNALYADCLTGEVRDPLGGLSDLAARRIRICGPDTLRSDALRILRLVRFAGELGFAVEEGTLRAARENAGLLADIAPERRREELMKSLLCDARYGDAPAFSLWDALDAARSGPPRESERVLEALLLLERIGAWEYLIPALTAGRGMAQRPDHHRHTVLEHAFHVCANTPPDPVLRLAGLLHDIGKPACLAANGNFYDHARLGGPLARQALAALRCPNAETDAVVALVREHMYDVQRTAKTATLRARFACWGRERTAQLILLREADIRGCGTDAGYVNLRWRALLSEMLADGTPFSESELAISGKDIMEAAGLPAGAAVGRIKRRLFLHCAKRPRDNTRERLLALAAGYARGGA